FGKPRMRDPGELAIALPLIVDGGDARLLGTDVRRRVLELAFGRGVVIQKLPVRECASRAHGGRAPDGGGTRAGGRALGDMIGAARGKLRGRGQQRQHANERTYTVHGPDPPAASATPPRGSPPQLGYTTRAAPDGGAVV